MDLSYIPYIIILVLAVVASVIIVEQKRIDKSLRYRIKFENLITTISSKFIHLSPGEIDNGINYALKKFGEFTDVDRSYIFMFNNNGNKIVNTHEWCNEETYSKINKIKKLQFKGPPPWLEELKNYETICIPDISKIKSNETAEIELLKSQGIKSIVAIPMIY